MQFANVTTCILHGARIKRYHHPRVGLHNMLEIRRLQNYWVVLHLSILWLVPVWGFHLSGDIQALLILYPNIIPLIIIFITLLGYVVLSLFLILSWRRECVILVIVVVGFGRCLEKLLVLLVADTFEWFFIYLEVNWLFGFFMISLISV